MYVLIAYFTGNIAYSPGRLRNIVKCFIVTNSAPSFGHSEIDLEILRSIT